MDTLIGTYLGGYKLQRVLGSGGMGTVYLAEDEAIGQQVAIKVVRTDDASYPDATSVLRANERFRQEARAIARLDHMYILPLYRYGEEEAEGGTRAYMVMQYRPEGSLWDWLRRRAGVSSGESQTGMLRYPDHIPQGWPMKLEEAGEYLRQAASALQYAHDRGIIHRDVKPANFLLRIDPKGASAQDIAVSLLLSDFGLAKFFSAASATSHIFGTPTYMAPEQFDGGAGPHSDQYALAVMIYYFLAGRPPFEGDPLQLMHRHLNMEPPPIRLFAPHIQQGIETVLNRALAKQPQQRFPSVMAFAEAFTQEMHRQTPIRPGGSLMLPGRAAEAGMRLSAYLPVMPSDGTVQAEAAAAPTVFEAPANTPLAPEASPTAMPAPGSGSLPAIPSSTVRADTEPTAYLMPQTMTPAHANAPWQAATVIPPTANQLHQPPTPLQAAPPSNPLYSAQVQSPSLPTASASPGMTQPGTGTTQMNRRSALGWILGGTAAVVIGGGTGLYLLAHRTRASSPKPFPTPPPTRSGLVHILHGHSGRVTAVAWAPDGSYLASASVDKTARIWNTGTWQSMLTYRGHSAALAAIAWDSRSNLIASAGADRSVQLWSPYGTHDRTFSGLKAAVSGLAWATHDLRLLVSTLGDGLHILFTDGAASRVIDAKTSFHALALSPDERWLALGLGTGGILLIAQDTVRRPLLYTAHNAAVISLAWSADSRLLASGSIDQQANILEVADGNVLYTLPHNGSVTGVAWQPGSNSRLATTATDGTLRIWSADDNTPISYQTYTPLTSLTWYKNTIAVGANNATILIFAV